MEPEDEDGKTVTATVMSTQVTPGQLTAYAANPILGSLRDKLKKKRLFKTPLIQIALKDNYVAMYVTEEILEELLTNCKVRKSIPT